MRRLFVVIFAVMLTVLAVQGAHGQGDAGGTTPVREMSDFVLWGIVGGALTSVVTAVINRQRWSSDLKLTTFFVLCCVTAAGDAYVHGDLTAGTWVRALLIVVASGWTTYLAAKPAIKQIEARTG